ncbi:MAG: ABC transporter permease [Candidatus Shapirobacteria bacterium]|jgi:putative ABC transport system permease protein
MLKPTLDELFKSSVRSILKNKGRTILTSLGIIIGVTSVILLTSIGNGLKTYVGEQFESLGSNSIFITPGRVFDEGGGFSRGGAGSMLTATFTQKDVAKIERQFKNFLVMPANVSFNDIKSPYTTKKSVETAGSTFQYGPNNNLSPSAENGRWFTKEEDDKKNQVIILGNKLASDLFPNGSALGKKIIIKGKSLKIIGVIDKRGASFGGPSIDDHAFIPLSVAFEISGNQDISTIVVKIPNKDEIDTAKKGLTNIMLQKYDEDAFSVFDSAQLLNSINAIISTLTIGLTGIAAISLVVGGIGIMNIMLVTVTERTREIGLRKAIGAYPRAILIQFLIEAMILSLLGGLVGVILGSAGTLLIDNFFPAKVTPNAILLAFGVSSLVGIIFGVAPANKASKLSPIEALRYE